MDIVLILLAAVLFTALLRKPLQRHPGIFYALAIVLDVLLVAGPSWSIPVALWRFALLFHSRCLFAFGLFAVVMFIGVLKEGSPLKQALLPVRAELSIFAALLALGHVLGFAALYLGRLLTQAAPYTVLVVGVAAALVVLLVPLTVTSFKAVKRRMGAATWKRLQRFAYLFWTLVFAHVLVVLGPFAALGAPGALESIAVYAVLFAMYAILRVYRALADRRMRTDADRLAFDGESDPLAA